jgi:GNAT superfamily N-acetyltransferase
MSDVVRELIPAGTWYLSILGVHPAHQGTGAGRALLAPTLDELDAIGAASYLETFTHPAVRFYQKLGYRIVGEATEPTLRESYWVMRRDPATRAADGSAI